ncbi:MAG: hypothetical protein Q4C12_03720 [Clostridia bacterium]|nr:hypothetical protein [Clostridia bacterium]
MKNNKNCKYCGALLEKDWIALNKKLLGAETEKYACLHCLANDFNCSIEDLETKIEEFKDQGCPLFL